MQSTPAFLPGESHGQRRLVGYSLWGHRESDMDWSDLAQLSTRLLPSLLSFYSIKSGQRSHSFHEIIRHPECYFFLLWIHICTTPVMSSCFLLYSSDVFLCIFLQELEKNLQKLCVSLMHFNGTYLTALQTKVTLPFLLILILMIIPCESEAIPSYVHLSEMLN